MIKDERYRTSSWVAVLLMLAQVFTGYFAIMAYSDVILSEIFTEDKAMIGNYIIALFNVLGSIASIYLIHRVGRRKILILGQALITLALLGMAATSGIKDPVLLLIMICSVTFVFQCTIGPLAPLYAAEICCDAALGLVMVAEDAGVLL